MTDHTPVTIDFTSRDYAAFRASMLAYAQQIAPEWKGAETGDPNDFGVVLVELLAYEGDILSYYADQIANEAFLSTATQRSSVLAHAALLDYTPRSATAASVIVAITVTSEQGIIIPAGFQVSTPPNGNNDTLIFETVADVTFPASSTPTTLLVTAHEGLTVADEVIGTSCGDLDASYTLMQTPVISDTLVVRVVEIPNDPGQVWFRVSNLLEAQPSDRAYMISLDENDALTVTFGDGVNGLVPPRGAVIHTSYRVGGGADGNVLAGTVSQLEDPTDYVVVPVLSDPSDPSSPPLPIDPSIPPPTINVTNQSAASGGTDSESLESIRTNAPKALRARQRAVTLSDYEALALTIPTIQIAKAKAAAQVYTNVTIYVAPPGGGQVDQDSLDAVVSYMESRKLAGVTVVAATATYVSVDIEISVQVDSRYSQVTVKQAVRNALDSLLSFDNVDFGGTVTLSSIYAVVTRVEGVVGVGVPRLSRDEDTTSTDVHMRDNELPILGTFTLVASGGVVNSASSEDVVGEGVVSPSSSSTPSVDLIRCDPSTTHVELSWVRGNNTTEWDVVVAFYDVSNVLVTSTVYGSFTNPNAVLDIPRIGAGRAAKITFTTRAYNNTTGPVESGTATVDYVCEGTAVAPTTVVGRSLSALWNVAAPSPIPILSGSNSFLNISLSWTSVTGAIGYTVYEDGNAIRSYGPANGTTAQLTSDFATSAGSHTYTVRAYTAQTGSVATATYGSPSNPLTLFASTAPPPPPPPTVTCGTADAPNITALTKSAPDTGGYVHIHATISYTLHGPCTGPSNIGITHHPEGYVDVVAGPEGQFFSLPDGASASFSVEYNQAYLEPFNPSSLSAFVAEFNDPTTGGHAQTASSTTTASY